MKRGFYDKVEKAAFDSYDPDFFHNVQMDGFDPDFADPSSAVAPSAATRVQSSNGKQNMQINLTLQNPTAVKLDIELFNAFDSWLDKQKMDLVRGAYTMIPRLSIQGLAAGDVGTIGTQLDGSIIIQGAAAAPAATIGCGEYPYRSLLESTKTLPFNVNFLRYTCNTDAQLNNGIRHFTKTAAGGVKENLINIRSYFKPTQFQNRIVDIKAPFLIDGEKGLIVPVDAGETVHLALFISRWTRPTL